MDTDTNYSFFNGNINNSILNATVGENGYHPIRDYADGYFYAVELIENELKRMIIQRKAICEDTIVYPICFNIRHSIELYLKEIYHNIIEIYELRNINIQSNLLIHDLDSLWGELKKIKFKTWNEDNIDRSHIFDERYDGYIDCIEEYIEAWASIDPTSQTFRYPFDRKAEKHLTEVSIICILDVIENSRSGHEKLKEFRYFSEILLSEFKARNFTDNLTFTQLEDIAVNLPNKSEWNNKEELNKIIDELSEKHKLAGRNAIKKKAIDHITNHYYLSSLIGVEHLFKNIDEYKLCEILQIINDYAPKEKQKHIEKYNVFNLGSEQVVSNLLEDSKKREAAKVELKKFDFSILIDFITLYYLGIDHYHLKDSKYIRNSINLLTTDESNTYENYYSFINKNFKQNNSEHIDELINEILSKSMVIDDAIRNALFIFNKEILGINK